MKYDTFRPAGRVRFEMRSRRLFFAAMWGLFAFVSSSGLAGDTHPIGAAFLISATAACLFCVVRSMRMSIEIDDYGVVIRGVVRTRRIGWNEIVSVEARGALPTPRWVTIMHFPWSVPRPSPSMRWPCFVLLDGSIARSEAVASGRNPSMVDDVIMAAQRRLGH